MAGEGLFLIILLAGATWYWWLTMRSKELAKQAGKQACDRYKVQFLDETVELKKVWIRRNETGRIEFCRLFFFEFATDGAMRYQGRVLILGQQISNVEMDAYREP